jgi:hypothetical protein
MKTNNNKLKTKKDPRKIRSFRLGKLELDKLNKLALKRKTNTSVVLRDLINTL